MRIDKPFSRLWYVHNSGAADTVWTTQREARNRKHELMASGASRVTISYVPLQMGTMVRDLKS